MRITREELPQREVQLTIELEPPDLEPYLHRGFQQVVQRKNIPGFRRGKAPRAVVERFVGKDALLDEALDFLIHDATHKAVEEEKLDQGGSPMVEVVQREPVILKARVPLAPLVELDDYRSLQAPQAPVTVADEEVQQTLEQLRRDLALWEPVQRPVALGDQVTMDVRGWVREKLVTDQKGVVYEAVAENRNPAPGFANALAGTAPGEVRDFTLNIPSEYRDRRLAGQSCRFQATVRELKERRLPELNDEFAKGVEQGYDTLEALKGKVRADLQAHKEREARRELEERLVEELVRRARVEVPPLLVEHEIDHLLQEEQRSFDREQATVEQYLQSVGKSPEEHREELRPLALARLNRTYVLRRLAQAEGLTVLPEEVEAELASLTQMAKGEGAALRRALSTPEGRTSMAEGILRRKLMDRLVAIAQGTSEAPSQAGSPEPAQEAKTGETEHARTTG